MENKKNFYINGKWVEPKGKEEIKVIIQQQKKIVLLYL